MVAALRGRDIAELARGVSHRAQQGARGGGEGLGEGGAVAAGRRKLLSDGDWMGAAAGGGGEELLDEAVPGKTESQSGGNKAVHMVEQGAVVAAVEALSGALCGLQALFSEVWFIEEQDLLALALNGRYLRHVAPLMCPDAG